MKQSKKGNSAEIDPRKKKNEILKSQLNIRSKKEKLVPEMNRLESKQAQNLKLKNKKNRNCERTKKRE